MYALASQQDVAFLMLLNFSFLEDIIYNGNALSVVLASRIAEDVREMPVISDVVEGMHWQRE
ncbi:unnamed protein product [Linum tenue]|uniref:Uncharacterized protein n=1 Tax=Linum tenue TaxID=586396 RepID=A0AAV0NU94_9ROSI|nr:unnamed protein product [Linum tenue]CAI0461798.1 unnamed protein product [Linum tenue]